MILESLSGSRSQYNEIISKLEHLDALDASGGFDDVKGLVKDWLGIEVENYLASGDFLENHDFSMSLENREPNDLVVSKITRAESIHYRVQFDDIDRVLLGDKGNEEAEYIVSLAIFSTIAERIENKHVVLSLLGLCRSPLVREAVCRRLTSYLSGASEKRNQFHETVKIISNDIYGQIAEEKEAGIYRNDFDQRDSFFTRMEELGNIYFRLDLKKIHIALSILRVLDKYKYLDCLAIIHYPEAIYELLDNVYVNSDPEEQIELIKCCFDGSGNPLDHKVLPILLVIFRQTIVNLNNLESGGGEPQQILKAFSEAISGRHDSSKLCYFWLVHLTTNDPALFDRNHSELTVEISEYLSKVVKENGTSLENLSDYYYELIAFASLEKIHLERRLNYLFCILLLVLNEDDELVDEDLNRLRELYIDALKHTRYGQRTAFTGQYLGYGDYHTSALFMRMIFPIEEWLSVWFQFEHARRKKDFYFDIDNDSTSSSDLTLAYAGLGIVEWMISGNFGKQEGVLELWKVLAQIAIERSAANVFEEWRVFLISVFARLPHIARLRSDSDMQILASGLELLGGDIELLASCIFAFHLNGVNLHELNAKTPYNLLEKMELLAHWIARPGAKKDRLHTDEFIEELLAGLRSTEL